MRSLDHLKPQSGSGRNFSLPSSRPASDNQMSLGSFTNLKLAAEKLVKEQTSVKMELETPNNKIKKSIEEVRSLKEKFKNAFNENLKLKVEQKEDEKLWKGLESKFSSTKVCCDQLSELLGHLAGKVEQAEKDKEFFQGKPSVSSNAIDDLNQQLSDLSLKLDFTEQTVRTREEEFADLTTENEENIKVFEKDKGRLTKLIEDQVRLCKLEDKIGALSESSRSTENEMKELVLKMAKLEEEYRASTEELQGEIQQKVDEIHNLQQETQKHDQEMDSLAKQVDQLQHIVQEKEELLLEVKEREKKLDDQINENQAALTAAEKRLVEVEKQYEKMLESRQVEFSRHLIEIVNSNDQAITDIRRKCDEEKLEIVNMVKEKVGKPLMESLRELIAHIKEVHAARILQMKQDNEEKELSLKAHHSEELKRAESESNLKIASLRSDHEAEIKTLRSQYEDARRKLEDELDLQRDKEDRQRGFAGNAVESDE